MNANTKSNLDQIKALRNSKIQSTKVIELLGKRITQAQRESASLRNFASKGKGRVADHCNFLASEIESAIK